MAAPGQWTENGRRKEEERKKKERRKGEERKKKGIAGAGVSIPFKPISGFHFEPSASERRTFGVDIAAHGHFLSVMAWLRIESRSGSPALNRFIC